VIAAYVGHEVGGLKLTEAAEHLRRGLATLSIGVKRLEGEMKRDAGLRRRVIKLCRALREQKRK